jgi:pimeloyl-ACP methyl ester carboxylesterase
MYTGRIETREGDHAASLISLTTGRHPTWMDRVLHANGQVLPARDVERLVGVEWQVPGLPHGLVFHAYQDADRPDADFLLGERPECWSPLAKVDHASFGFLSEAALPLRDTMIRDPRTLNVEPMEGTTRLRFEVDGESVALLSVALDCFAVAIPAEAVAITVRVGHDQGLADRPTMVSSLPLPRDEAPANGFDELIVWRVYSGSNSLIREAWTLARKGVHRLLMGAVDGPCFAVGRAVRSRSRTLDAEHGDPTFSLRLGWAEKKIAAHLLQERLVAGAGKFGDAVVVVHGTMSTAVHFAAAVSKCTPPGVPVLRFEHDTWRSLEENAADLAGLLESHVQGSTVLVAHSRGGLVATRAAQKLQVRTSRSLSVVTLGTPFDGTAMAVAADVGYMGIRALMGGLRLATGPVVDAFTRLAGIAIKSTPPRGLQVMYPSNDALPVLRDTLGHTSTAFAGHVTHDRQNRLGLAGFGRGVFEHEPSDLVVPTASASHNDSQPVECDHFGYLEEPTVLSGLTTALGGLTPSPMAPPVTPAYPDRERQTW